tara:strand:- start:151 stop:507 length:357 start_codon:yes stop_codon:yes gene_type:complete
LIIFFFKKLILKFKSRKFEFDLKRKIIKEKKIIKELKIIDKKNKESCNNDNLLMEKRKLKALENPQFDLFYEEEKNLHLQRLKLNNQSKWKGVVYYKSKKGVVYTISNEGNKIYKNFL